MSRVQISENKGEARLSVVSAMVEVFAIWKMSFERKSH